MKNKDFDIAVPWDIAGKYIDIIKLKKESDIVTKYSFAKHTVDEKNSWNHWHIAFHTESKFTYEKILKWFPDDIRKIGCSTDKPDWHLESNGIEGVSSSFETRVVYHAHKTLEAVAQGKSAPLEHISNLDIGLCIEKYNSKVNDTNLLEHLIDDIMSGNLPEYKFYSDAFQGVRKKLILEGNMSKIRECYKDFYNNESLKIGRRNNMIDRSKLFPEGDYRREGLLAMWISGFAGLGKTMIAKYYARNIFLCSEEEIYITSSGKNPFDDYKGQPIVIWDDIDTKTTRGKDLLHSIDTFNRSNVGARYYNKVVNAEVFIFTASIGPTAFWNEICPTIEKIDGSRKANPDGNVKQLLRRLTLGYLWFADESKLLHYTYDLQGNPLKPLTAVVPDEISQVTKREPDNSQMFSVFHGDRKVSDVTVNSDGQIEKILIQNIKDKCIHCKFYNQETVSCVCDLSPEDCNGGVNNG